ncbi:MAG: hypothetical protein SAK29_31385 [Scytonema sp. PMC 1069.18]|nr:hypothetical protein [Scytonema sp. PMC 1069.18]MEC4884341.1 hypothetical protein [Scytonema sp. PMC 1070.18]
MKETAAQILLRTALRFYKIRDLEMPEIKRLMALSEEDFEQEFSKMESEGLIPKASPLVLPHSKQ